MRRNPYFYSKNPETWHIFLWKNAQKVRNVIRKAPKFALNSTYEIGS